MTRPIPRPKRGFALFAVALALLLPAAAKEKIKDLTDTVLANRIMTQFALVLANSELESFLSSRGPFTLFAPTDSAFSKLPPGELETLLRPEYRDVLQRILLFHLVNGNRYSVKDLAKLKTLPSCEGTALALHLSRTGAQLVQKAKILRADVRCANGVIDEIDTVLIPPDVKLPDPLPPGTPPLPVTNAPDTSTNAPAAADTNAAPATNAPEAEAATNSPPATNAPAVGSDTNASPATNTP